MAKSNIVVLGFVVLILFGCKRGGESGVGGTGEKLIPVSNLKVAFFGDQGLGNDSIDVLQLVLEEGADAVVHLGDFDYEDDPEQWNDQINDYLGSGFPYFVAVGNHDEDAWEPSDETAGYQALAMARLNEFEGEECEGEYGVKSACSYKGLWIVLSGIGTALGGSHASHESYLQTALQRNAMWKICAWHKNQNAMQVGDKGDDVHWPAYEMCREAGAIIATGHEHSYERTHLLSDMSDQTVASTSNLLMLDPGKTFAFVSGLGGTGIRDQNQCEPTTPPYGCNGEWASIYTSEQGANFGVLFCTFHVNGMPNRASCYFKAVNGAVPDTFEIQSNL